MAHIVGISQAHPLQSWKGTPEAPHNPTFSWDFQEHHLVEFRSLRS